MSRFPTRNGGITEEIANEFKEYLATQGYGFSSHFCEVDYLGQYDGTGWCSLDIPNRKGLKELEFEIDDDAKQDIIAWFSSTHHISVEFGYPTTTLVVEKDWHDKRSEYFASHGGVAK